MRVLRIIVLSVLLSLCSPAWASPTAEVVSTADMRACGAPMGGDQIRLVVREGTQVLASLETCSSMGIATAGVAVSGRNTYVLLQTRDGHGTPYGAIYTEDLRVYQLAAGELVLCNRFRIGEPVGLFARWRYAYAATPSTGGGIRITLRLRVEIYEDEQTLIAKLCELVCPQSARALSKCPATALRLSPNADKKAPPATAGLW